MASMMLSAAPAQAADISDGVWAQSGNPGTTTVTFDTSTGIASGDKIVLSFPGTYADVNAAGTNISMTGSTTPTRINDSALETISVTADGSVSASGTVTITLTDGLTSFTTANAIESVGINHTDSDNNHIDSGLALITNDNDTDVSALVPLYVAIGVDDTNMPLGTLSIAGTNSNTQQYTVDTNNFNGVSIYLAADDNLKNSNGDTIDVVADGSVDAQSEEYGITLASSGITQENPFDSGTDALPTSATKFAGTTAPVAAGTVDITYEAAIASTTAAGTYTQTVTVTAVANP